MTPTPTPPSGSRFWSSLPLPGYDHPIWWVVGIVLYLVGVAAVVLLATLDDETAAGVEMAPPADGAEVAAGSVAPALPVMPAGPDRAAPAPTAPAEGSGAVGVTPFDWFDARSVREAAQAAEVEALTGGGR